MPFSRVFASIFALDASFLPALSSRFVAANSTSFTKANAADYGRKGGQNGKGVSRAQPRSQILKLQRVAVSDAVSTETPVGVRASLMRAYVDLQELRMNLEGVGKPKPVEARNSTNTKRKRSAGPLRDSAPADSQSAGNA